jgi:nitrogen fixation NifU-like protein
MAGLYQEMIIEHAHSPRNLRQLEGAHQTVEALNPLCGDHLTLYLQRDGDRIADIAFEGDGCAISKASASLMTSAVKGLQSDEALALFRRVHTMLTTKPDGDGPRTVLASSRCSRAYGNTRHGSNVQLCPGRPCTALSEMALLKRRP